jgi:hypothetical protein
MHTIDDDPSIVLRDRAAARQSGTRGLVQAGEPDAHTAASEQLIQTPGGEDTTVGDDRHAVADLLDLAEQV